MFITPEVVDSYKKIIENPSEHGLSFKPLKECFVASEEATAKHILYKQYTDYIDKPLPKMIFYIIMDDLYPQAKASDGNLGYKVKFKELGT